MSAATLQRPEQTVAWECRGHWAAHRRVVLTLSDRWHVPTVEILGVARPHHSQRDTGQQA